MFRSFPLCSCGMGYRQSRMTLNGNSKGRDTKNGLSFADSHLFCRKLLCFPPIENYSVFLRSFPFSLPFDLRSGILLFSFFFYCSFSFFSFHFFLFFPLPPFLSLGNRVLAFYSLSLEEIPLSFALGERMRILFYRPRFKKA